jgi:hypothetical protein
MSTADPIHTPEPNLTTPPELQSILDDLRRREPLLHKPEFPDHAAQLADSFWEVGASGNRYSREYVLHIVTSHEDDTAASTWTSEGHHCRQLSPDTYLFTYTLHQGHRITRRTTIWQKNDAGWKALYHQGTIVGPDAI